MAPKPTFARTRWRDSYRWHGDMLADEKRNRAYSWAVKEWVRQQIEEMNKNESTFLMPSVLEIGTGSGLLLSLVAQEFALQWPSSSVSQLQLTGCEVVAELHDIAFRNFQMLSSTNSKLPQINLLPRSHSLEIDYENVHNDSFRPANLVISELLDTGLLGEGLIPSMRDAKKRLTNKQDSGGYMAIPAYGFVIAALCEGSVAYRMATLRDDDPSPPPSTSSFRRFKAPRMCTHCTGSAAAEGMHFRWRPSSVWPNRDEDNDEKEGLRSLTIPQQVLSFDLSDPPTSRNVFRSFIIESTGMLHGISYWWRVDMLKCQNNQDQEDQNDHCLDNSVSYDELNQANGGHGSHCSVPFMTTAPSFTGPPDHWRQNLVPLTNPHRVYQGDVVDVAVKHDEDMIWFEIVAINGARTQIPSLSSLGHTGKIEHVETSAPICSCGVHVSHSRLRLLELNNPQRRATLKKAVRSNFQNLAKDVRGVVVVLGGGPLLPFYAADAGYDVIVINFNPRQDDGGHQIDETVDFDICFGDDNAIRDSEDLIYLKSFSNFLTHRCIFENGLNSHVVLFANHDWSVDPDEEQGSGRTLFEIIQQGVEKIIETRSALRQGELVEGSVPAITAIAGNMYESVECQLVSEPYFNGVHDPSSGWGWEALLLLLAAVQSLRNGPSSFDNEGCAAGEASGSCSKRQKTTSLRICQIEPVVKLAPRQAIIRGCFLNSEKLWQTLVPPRDGMVEGVVMSAAFEVDPGESSTVKQQSFLRCVATGDVFQDAVPFTLHQWSGVNVVGEVLDLLKIDLVAYLQDQTPTFENTVFVDLTANLTSSSSSSTSSPIAHAFCVWIDYQMNETTLPIEGTKIDQDGWLLNGPSQSHASQGVLALESPFDSSDSGFSIGTSLSDQGCLDIHMIDKGHRKKEKDGIITLAVARDVKQNRFVGRFNHGDQEEDDIICVLLYRMVGKSKVDFYHTETLRDDQRNKGYARQLVQTALAWAHGAALQVIPTCGYVAKVNERSLK